jgi:hypothetical protein
MNNNSNQYIKIAELGEEKKRTVQQYDASVVQMVILNFHFSVNLFPPCLNFCFSSLFFLRS